MALFVMPLLMVVARETQTARERRHKEASQSRCIIGGCCLTAVKVVAGEDGL